ncbi:hypothetical protein HOY34_11160 [Xinfangfangia sp. D13-10-4-6]|uniref:hypothetical protein n=1 Tax=Pseudogemmobacter hezensis TaxID=2737662 RepID=UPI0015534802|nr:hypothetical protein [Pseudogemmobacter hezensis]NPD15761.1 hypothetical protein [Pseudogemmobacter hezensis]
MIRRRDDVTLAELIEWRVSVLEGMLLRSSGSLEWADQVIADFARDELLALGCQPPLIGGQHGLN